jgi:protein phosphatase
MDEQTSIRAFGLTDIGRVRAHNEDAIHVAAQQGYVVLADGMGGHNAGEVASALAIAAVCQHFSDPSVKASDNQQASLYSIQGLELESAVQHANTAILAAAQQDKARQGMGTALVTAKFSANRVFIGHVGDSRLYRFRDGFLEQLTTDHTLVQEWIRRKLYTQDEARHARNKNVITRALGLIDELVVDVREELLQIDDVYLLCSDGLTGMVTDQEIANVLGGNLGDLELVARQLLDMANTAGGSDNISIIVVCVDNVIAGHDDVLD